MSARAEAVAKERDLLLQRSALCRLRLLRGVGGLRNAVSWRRLEVAGHAASVARRAGFVLVLSLLGLARGARFIATAGRVLLVARAAQVAIGFVRQAGSPGSQP